MNTKLLILIAVAAAVLLFVYMRSSSPANTTTMPMLTVIPGGADTGELTNIDNNLRNAVTTAGKPQVTG